MKQALESARLLSAAYAVRQTVRTVRPEVVRGILDTRQTPAAEPPLPPLRLVYAVSGTFHRAAFRQTGKDNLDDIVAVLGDCGVDAEHLGPVLDFGCGCGRLLRHWPSTIPTAEVYGTDYDGTLVDWCQQNLPDVETRRNHADPPLDFDDDFFDVAYAISVFTHLDEARQRAWVDELARVIKPGGHLVITTLGQMAAQRALSDRLFSSYVTNGMLVTHGRESGRQVCAVYHDAPYLKAEFAPQLEFVAFYPERLRWSVHDMTVYRVPER